MIRIISIKLLLLFIWCNVYSQINDQNITIFFNDSAARCVLENPEYALKKRDSIWNTFEGYRITRVWHEKQAYPITWEIWEKGLHKYTNIDRSLIRKSLYLLNNISEYENNEHNKIIQHLSSYLPAANSFNANVYFIAFTIPYAFCVEQNKIGIDITADEWNFDANCLINMIIHELYHIGYQLNSPDTVFLNTDPINSNQFVNLNYAILLNEGMATHVAFKALDLFPSEYKHDDYKLMEEEKNIKKAISGINTLLEMTKTATIDTLNKKVWEIGITQRAYYIAGAYICKIVEEKYGKDYLTKILFKGSRNIIKVYNTLVPDAFKINII